jgi:hypothetical protein
MASETWKREAIQPEGFSCNVVPFPAVAGPGTPGVFTAPRGSAQNPDEVLIRHGGGANPDQITTLGKEQAAGKL